MPLALLWTHTTSANMMQKLHHTDWCTWRELWKWAQVWRVICQHGLRCWILSHHTLSLCWGCDLLQAQGTVLRSIGRKLNRSAYSEKQRLRQRRTLAWYNSSTVSSCTLKKRNPCTVQPLGVWKIHNSKLKARTSLLPRFTEKRGSSFELWALKQHSKMSPQMGLAVSM